LDNLLIVNSEFRKQRNYPPATSIKKLLNMSVKSDSEYPTTAKGLFHFLFIFCSIIALQLSFHRLQAHFRSRKRLLWHCNTIQLFLKIFC